MVWPAVTPGSLSRESADAEREEENTGEHALSVDVMRSRTPTHLMWIVRHCQANEASRL